MTLFLDAAAATGSGSFSMLLMIVIMFAVFYFFVIRPENKKKKKTEEMRNSLSLGDAARTESASKPRSGPFPPRQRWKRKRQRKNKYSARMKQHPCQYDLLSYGQGVFFCLNRKRNGSIYRCLSACSQHGAFAPLHCLPAHRPCMPRKERIYLQWAMQARLSVLWPLRQRGSLRGLKTENNVCWLA